jgi:hypothetical protein
MNQSRILQYLLSAMMHAGHACERTRELVRVAVARFLALQAIDRMVSA